MACASRHYMYIAASFGRPYWLLVFVARFAPASLDATIRAALTAFVAVAAAATRAPEKRRFEAAAAKVERPGRRGPSSNH